MSKSKPELKLVEDTGSQLQDEDLSIELPPQQSEMPFAVVEGEPVTQLPRDLYIPPDALQVFLTAFEGPLDLLLYLIRKQNLDILNIPIAEITRQYMKYIEVMAELQLELAGEYLLMAAMLAEIKSRMLLPRPASAEGQDEDDPRAELVRRLQEYERFKKAAEDIDRLTRLERDTMPASAELEERKVSVRPPDVTLKEMLDAFRDVLARAEKFAHHHISRERLSQRERMTEILARLQTAAFFEFTQLFKPEEGRMGVTVTFIAILELMKEGLIEIVQAEAYAPIHVRTAQRHLKVVQGGGASETADAENVAALAQPELAGENDIPDEDDTPPADDAAVAVQAAVADVAAASSIAADSVESDHADANAPFVEAAVSEALASTESAVDTIASEEAAVIEETSVIEGTAVIEESSVIEDTFVTEETSVTEAPVTDESSMIEESAVTDETSVIEDTFVTEQTSVIDESVGEDLRSDYDAIANESLSAEPTVADQTVAAFDAHVVEEHVVEEHVVEEHSVEEHSVPEHVVEEHVVPEPSSVEDSTAQVAIEPVVESEPTAESEHGAEFQTASVTDEVTSTSADAIAVSEDNTTFGEDAVAAAEDEDATAAVEDDTSAGDDVAAFAEHDVTAEQVGDGVAIEAVDEAAPAPALETIEVGGDEAEASQTVSEEAAALEVTEVAAAESSLTQEANGDSPLSDELANDDVASESLAGVTNESPADVTGDSHIDDPAPLEPIEVAADDVQAVETTNVVIDGGSGESATAEPDGQTIERTGELSVGDDTVTGASGEADNSDAESSR